MLAVHGGRLLSIADYYKMACDTIHEKFGITSGSFIEQMSLLHHIAYDKDDEVNEVLVNIKTEQLAGAIPLFTNRQVAFRAVKMYQELINSQRQALMAAAPVTKGDSIFHKIIDRYKGNVVFMDFWDLSCGSCRVEMLKQREDVEFFKDKNVKFLYVCNEKNNPRNVADSFFEENHIAGEHIFISPDEWNYLAEKFQFQAIPFTLLIDKNGNIVERNAHPSRAKIESLLR
jgi:peroxiredoxin